MSRGSGKSYGGRERRRTVCSAEKEKEELTNIDKLSCSVMTCSAEGVRRDNR